MAAKILITGSSGYLGEALVRRFVDDGWEVIGLDPRPGPQTHVVASVDDRDAVAEAIRGARAVVHAGALHKPDIERYARRLFVKTNVEGTLNLLELAVAPGSTVESFVMTSTTSVMVSKALRERKVNEAAWITEDYGPLVPRNIYGVTKLSAEHMCRMVHEQTGLAVVILRTSRFFPEDDDSLHEYVQSDANIKANEYLFRRLSREDAVQAHVDAVAQAPRLGFDTLIVSAPTPFVPEDCEALMHDAPAVVERYVPEYKEVYTRLGWTMFQTIDRVYVPTRARERLGFEAKVDFRANLRRLDALALEIEHEAR